MTGMTPDHTPCATGTGLTIATVCARGGSKGLPGKNIRDFLGKPLIAHTIAQALACPSVQGVYVSTDDEAIAQIARSAGATVPYLRPAELANDAAPKLPVIEHLVQHLEAQGLVIDRVVDLQPTSPLREAADISRAMACQTHAETGSLADLVVSVRAAADNPYFNLVEPGVDGWLGLSKGSGNTRRQAAPQVFALNGSIYVWQREALRRSTQAGQGLWTNRIARYEMPNWKSVDIDDLEDFELAEWMAVRHGWRAA